MNMETSNYNELNQFIIDHYGADRQTNLATEELAELIQAINKMKRYPDGIIHRQQLIEEMADVRIMLDQLQLIYNIDFEDIAKVVGYKIGRELKRIERGNI